MAYKTHCSHGHKFSKENTVVWGGKRRCRICVTKWRHERLGRSVKPISSDRSECPQGHKYTSDNTTLYRGRRYCKTCNRIRNRRQASKRRESKMSLDAGYSDVDEQHTRDMFGERCFKCKSMSALAIDHHYPLSRGFGLSSSNAVLLCKSCNSSKGNKWPEEFYSAAELKILAEKHGILTQVINC